MLFFIDWLKLSGIRINTRICIKEKKNKYDKFVIFAQLAGQLNQMGDPKYVFYISYGLKNI